MAEFDADELDNFGAVQGDASIPAEEIIFGPSTSLTGAVVWEGDCQVAVEMTADAIALPTALERPQWSFTPLTSPAAPITIIDISLAPDIGPTWVRMLITPGTDGVVYRIEFVV